MQYGEKSYETGAMPMTTPVTRPTADELRQDPQQPRGMADPAAWAVIAFATTSFMLGMYNSGLLNPAGVAIVIPAAFFFAGLIQIIVAVLEIAHGNLFGAVVFGSYGPFWVIYGAVETLYATSIPSGQLSSALSLFLAMWAVLSFIFTVAALRIDAVLVTILGLVTAGLILLAIGIGGGMSGISQAGGWVTLAFAVLSWYYAAARLLESTFGHKVLPVGALS